MKEYRLICKTIDRNSPSVDVTRFERMVNEALAQGWETAGGVCAIGNTAGGELMQAVVCEKIKP